MSSTPKHSRKRESIIDRFRQGRPMILPSMLQCDFGSLEREINLLREAGATALHLDVMDGSFVPNISYGMPIVEGVKKYCGDMIVDVHLMITQPHKYASEFVNAGADAITFHVEAYESNDAGEEKTKALLSELKGRDVAAGLAINPPTEMARLEPFESDCDYLLIMSVNAGFGGQKFDAVALERISSLRSRHGAEKLLQIDGGINTQTIASAKGAGCDLFVVGSAIFGQPNYRLAIDELNELACS